MIGDLNALHRERRGLVEILFRPGSREVLVGLQVKTDVGEQIGFHPVDSQRAAAKSPRLNSKDGAEVLDERNVKVGQFLCMGLEHSGHARKVLSVVWGFCVVLRNRA